MAKQTNLAVLLGDDDAAHETATRASQATGEQADQEAPKRPTRPRKKGAARKGAAAKKAAQKRSQAAETPSESSAASEETTQVQDGPVVLAADSKTAVRVSLYLHPDDLRMLRLAHVDDGADHNARIRSLLAVYRHNSRLKTQVDRLARTAPRGGQRRPTGRG